MALQSWEYVQTEVEVGRVRDWARALAEETGAGVVISGAIYPDGDSIEVQVEVTDVERGVSVGNVPAVRGSRAAERELIANVQQQVMGFLWDLWLDPLRDHSGFKEFMRPKG